MERKDSVGKYWGKDTTPPILPATNPGPKRGISRYILSNHERRHVPWPKTRAKG